jgi:NADPH-dependent glutamate synthase beta subunit-like oxidoreductase
MTIHGIEKNGALSQELEENKTTPPPCAGACPADLPSARCFTLLNQGKFQEAAELLFEFSPFPASVCGAVCPDMCMKAYTRINQDAPLDSKTPGRPEENNAAPAISPASNHKIAIIGAGPAGLTAAWLLALRGHQVDLYESGNRLGGKLWDAVDKGILQRETLVNEIKRIKSTGLRILPENLVTPRQFEKIGQDYDGVIITCGLQKKDGRGLRFLSTDIECTNGKININPSGQTSNPKIFAAGDVISEGLPPQAVGQARKSALALHAFLQGV